MWLPTLGLKKLFSFCSHSLVSLQPRKSSRANSEDETPHGERDHEVRKRGPGIPVLNAEAPDRGEGHLGADNPQTDWKCVSGSIWHRGEQRWATPPEPCPSCQPRKSWTNKQLVFDWAVCYATIGTDMCFYSANFASKNNPMQDICTHMATGVFSNKDKNRGKKESWFTNHGISM